MTAKIPAPVVLDGAHVRLEPLTLGHTDDLFAAVGSEAAAEVFRWTPGPLPETVELMRERVAGTLAMQERGEYSAFAVVHQESGRAVGSTCFMDVPEWPAAKARLTDRLARGDGPDPDRASRGRPDHPRVWSWPTRTRLYTLRRSTK
jgi:RimJ/RimL family protein N-acetyltransferase